MDAIFSIDADETPPVDHRQKAIFNTRLTRRWTDQEAGLRIQRWWRSCMIRREEMFEDLVGALADLREEAAVEIQYSVGIVRRGGSLRSFGRQRFRLQV